METVPTLTGVLWVLVIWIALTAPALGVAIAVLASLPAHFFRDATPHGDRTRGWTALRRVARNVLGALLIVFGLAASIPGVPGQGIITILAGVLLVDVPGRHRLACALARLPGVLAALNRIRRRLRRPPLLAPEPPRRGPRRRKRRADTVEC
jgi:hypothetical protein